MSRVFFVIFSGILAFSALAAENESQFSFRGFGSVGASRSNTDHAEFVRDLSQPRGITKQWSPRTDTIFGVQANYQFSRQLEGVVQAVSRYRYDRTYTPDITWAYLKYEPAADISLRAGRLGTEFFMLSDSRLVGYSYLTVRPPGDFFWHLPFYSIDGADAAVSWPLGEAIVRAKVFTGISDERVALADQMWKLDGSRMSGGYLDYQDGPWMLRASYANIRFSTNLPIDNWLNLLPAPMSQQARDYLATANTRADYYSLGMVYDRGPWQVQFMLNRIEQSSHAFQSSAAGYALAGYRLGAWTPFVGYSRVVSQVRNQGLQFGNANADALIAGIMADSHADQKTYLLGVRWDVARNMALKLQWDIIRGEKESVFPYRNETKQPWSGNMNVLSSTLDFIF